MRKDGPPCPLCEEPAEVQKIEIHSLDDVRKVYVCGNDKCDMETYSLRKRLKFN